MWRYSSQAYDIIQRMGWTEGGMGKNNTGVVNPLPAGRPRQARLGLGHPGTKKTHNETRSTGTWVQETRQSTQPTRSNTLKKNIDKLRAVVTSVGSVVYGYPDYTRATLEVTTISMKGVARRSGEKLDVNPDHLERVVRWNGKVMGRATATFPHPKSWRLGTIDRDIDKIDVKALTREISQEIRVLPSCIAAWAERIGLLPDDIGGRYNNALLTPKDWASHFKNVLHRNMWTKGHDDNDKACRCCKHAYENLQHFATCDVLGKLFASLAEVIADSGVDSLQNYDSFTERDKERFALFALTPAGSKLEAGWVNLHLLIWKYIIYSLTVLQTEGTPFHTHSVWQAAWTRFTWKAEALGEKNKTTSLRAESRGEEPPDSSSRGSAMSPLAAFTKEGTLIWKADIKETMEKMMLPQNLT